MQSACQGAIQGSKPDWHLANWLDNGHQKTPNPVPQVLGSSRNWGEFYASSPKERPSRRVLTGPSTKEVTGPCAHTGHPTYYARRSTLASAPPPIEGAYKRHQHPAQPLLKPERTGGLKMVPQTFRNMEEAVQRKPRRVLGTLEGPEMRQPNTGRLGRAYAPVATGGLSAETSLERAIARKVRVNAECYFRSGCAGDLSVKRGTADRVEDAPGFFRKAVDSPTFARFAAAVAAKPSTRPAERRRKGLLRTAEAARALEASAVAQLEQWDQGRSQDE